MSLQLLPFSKREAALMTGAEGMEGLFFALNSKNASVIGDVPEFRQIQQQSREYANSACQPS
jgi:hypothetical protein